MKYCMHCGQVMPDAATVCGRCGYGAAQNGPVPPPVPRPDAVTDRAVLDQVRVGLRHERTAWKIGGIIFCVFAAIFLLCAIMFGAEGSSSYSSSYSRDYALMLQIYAITYAVIAIVAYVPCAVACFVMTGKCSRYLNNFSGNPGAAVQRCGSVGLIVLGALFNTIALIFIIINFVRCKSNREALERAVRQEEKPFSLPSYFETDHVN